MRHGLTLSMVLMLTVLMSAAKADAESEHAMLITPGTPIVVSKNEPAPVLRAAKDLQRDMAKVFGKPSPILYSTDELGHRSGIFIVGPDSKLVSKNTRWAEGSQQLSQ